MPPLFTPQLLDDAQSETSQNDDPGRNALSLEDGVGATLDQRQPDLGTTRTALPIGTGGDTAPAGRQGPQPPEAPEFPRLDVPTDAPQRDEDARRQDRIMALLGALGATAAAAGDDPVALNVAGGLAKGASQDLQRRKQSFAKRQQAFQEMVTEAEKFNRRQKRREVEAQFERDLARFKQGQQNRRQRAQATQDRIQAEREQERALEQIRARGQQRRKSAALRNDLDSEDGTDNTAGDASKGDASKAPAGYEPKKVRTEEGFKVWEMQDGEVVGEHGGLTEDQADRLLRQLRERGRPLGPLGPDMLDSQTRTGMSSTDSTRTDSTAAPADTTAPDTTVSDTTTTRGLGRTPGHVAPQELGMKTSGGNPGGGLSKPSSGGTRLRNMGGQPRSIEKLMSEAESLVAELGPQVVRRRLTQLVERGRVDRQTAQTVRRRAELLHRYDRIAVERSPKAALDTLEADLIRGDVTDGEARRLADRLEERYAR
jgi:hypothetical protein